MTFIWPWMLVCLLLAPATTAGYAWLSRRRRTQADELGTMGQGPVEGRRVRLHLPFSLFLSALVVLLIALARPQMVVALPRLEGTVILAFDVSNSMIADDLDPTRLDAAKTAAISFVEQQPQSIDIGVVAFSDGGLILQAPTNTTTDVLDAIERMSPEGGTSISDGILTSLNAIAGEPIDLGDPTQDDGSTPLDVSSVDIDYFGSAVIILLTDGEDTTPADPTEFAQLAANAGVRIYPIGIGSPEGAVLEIDGFNIATTLNEELLTEIATITDGAYQGAEDADQLEEIYSDIDLELTVDGEDMEVTGLFGAAGLVLLLTGGVFTILWNGKLP
jgi:Ca-activated chloride channel family protein